MFNPAELREIARIKRFERAAVAAQEPGVTLSAEDLDRFIKDIEGHVETFAADGYEEVTYLFPEDLEIASVSLIAHEFKTRQPFLMVITSLGEKSLTVTWAKN